MSERIERPGIWWVSFKVGKSLCYYGTRTDVEKRAAERGVVLSIDTLPYPAEPMEPPVSKCPAFCYTPNECKGRTSCPKRYACSE